jgi:hypothetical protein
MKFIKLNAILMIFCFSIYCFENENKKTETEVEKTNIERRLPKLSMDAYIENDIFINKLNEKHIIERANRNTQQNSVLTNKTQNKRIISNIFVEKTQKQNTKEQKIIKKNESQSSQIKILRLNNEDLKPDSSLEKEEQCIQKNGIISIIKSQTLNEISLYPVYLKMNLESLNFFNNLQESSLFTSIKLKDILRINQEKRLTESNCFEIVYSDFTENNTQELKKSFLDICLQSKPQMNSWINQIGLFKQCRINSSNIDGNKQILYDFQKVNEINKSSPQNSEKQNSPLYYDPMPRLENPIQKVKETQIKKTIKNILHSIKLGKKQQDQIHRQMTAKLKDAKKFSDEIHKKQEVIKKMMEVRINKEHSKEEKLIKLEQKNKEIEMLKAVQKKINDLKKKEVEDYKKDIKNQIKNVHLSTNKEANGMMKMLDQRFNDFKICHSQQLLNFSDTIFVTNTCQSLYGENGLDKCIKKENFCQMCCDNFIKGVKYTSQSTICLNKCILLVSPNSKIIDTKKQKIFDKILKNDKQGNPKNIF